MKFLPFLLSVLVILSGCEQKPTLALLADSDLKIGSAHSGTLQKHQADTFALNFAANSFVHGQADQLTVDVVVQIFDPEKKKIAEFDGPARGPENYRFTTSKAGQYRLVVLPFEDNEGDYALKVNAAEPLASTPAGRIEQIMKALVPPDGEVPGASIAVEVDGRIDYAAGFGYADLEHGVRITPKTIFHVASVSKQFTAFAIAMLADQGKLSLQDDIRKYLPEIHDFGHTITIDHLVHHTSGLRDQWNLLALAGWRLDDVITQDQVMRLISRQRELNFKPGDEMLYCNTGFTLMAEIVERVTGESFSEWTKKNIFGPLEMKSTFFFVDHERVVKDRAYSYHQGSSPGEFKKSVLSYANAGATSLFTTVEDLSRWAMNFENTKVGSENVMRMMDQRFVLNNGDTIDYAFGQSKLEYKGLQITSHGGADAGYRTFFLRVPDHKFSVSVLSNLASFNPGALAFQITDLYLGDQMREEPEEGRTPPQNVQEAAFDPASVKLSEFTGRYTSGELDTSYDLVVESDTLIARHQRHDDIRFTATEKDIFRTTAWFMGRVEFVRDKTNRITGMKVGSGRVRNLKFDRVSK